jgi:transcriptional regulator with XRE-family HTH domain
MSKDLRKKLGARIARYRQEAGLSQEKLAEKVGIRPETVSRLERGHTLPSIETIAEIGKVLGAELHELLNLGPAKRGSNAAIEDLVTILVNRPESHVRLVQRLAVSAFEILDQQGPKRSR